MIGVIGAIGAGKSLVSSALGRRGAFVLDADAVGHALLTQRPVREQVVARFGTGILKTPDEPAEPAAIDRGALGALVFADPAARRSLEAILHPRMRKTFERAIARIVRRGEASAVVLDAAILFEAGWNTLCDQVVLVDAPRTQRLERLSAQRGWTEATLAARERAQWPIEEKRRLADTRIENDAGIDRLESEVDRLWQSLQFTPPRVTVPGVDRPKPSLPNRGRRGM